uniref:Uncharacterized protein n=1 Tax=Arundo donax TaxID=35708 RepID=A0A0A9E1F6_ARUDO
MASIFLPNKNNRPYLHIEFLSKSIIMQSECISQ